MGCLKGQSFIHINEYFNEKGHQNLKDQLKPLLSEKTWSALYHSTITPITWIDLKFIMEDMIAKDKHFGSGDWTFMDQMLADIAERQFKGIYKILISVFNTERVLKKAPGLWLRFYNIGDFSLQNFTQGHAQLKLENFPDIPLLHEKLLIPYIRRLLELCGNKNIVITHPKCIAKGDSHCITDLSWK